MSSLTDIEQQLRHLSREAREDLVGWIFDSFDAEVAPNLAAEAHPTYADQGSCLMTVEEYLQFEDVLG